MACRCKVKNVKNNNSKQKTCDGCYPNPNVSPITVKLTKKSRYPPYLQPNIKPINFDYLFPKYTSSNISGTANVDCEKCAKMIAEKDFQLKIKELEISQLKARFGHGAQHNYRAIRRKEFELYRREQDIARMKMEAARQEWNSMNLTAIEKPQCAGCSGFLRQRELRIQEIEQEVVKQMASPYIKVNENPCYCCSGRIQPKSDEKGRKKHKDNCFKELNKREKKLKKKEKDIDKKIKKFRKQALAEAVENLKKIPKPGEIPKDLILNCKCPCSKTNVRRMNMDPCSYNPNNFWGTMPCSMPGLNKLNHPNQECTTKCCVLKLLRDIAACALPCGRKNNCNDCFARRLLGWWVCKQAGR